MTGAPAPAPAPAPARAGGGAGAVVRRIILLSLLFALITVAAIGISGLLARAIGFEQVIAEGEASLARSLAFAVIGTPLAAALWWWQRRRLADPAERASLVWTLYLTAMTLTALVTATVSLALTANGGIDGEWRPDDAAAALVWAGVWVWHRRMRRHARTAPTRLADLPVQLSAVWGLVIGALGAVAAIAALIARALTGGAGLLASGGLWWQTVLQSLVWLALGAGIWWWHWHREGARGAPGLFAAVLLVIVVGAAAATTLIALANTLHTVLRMLVSGATADVLAPLDMAVAAAAVGAVLWVYHAGVLGSRPDGARQAGRLVVSAIALIQAASGFGVIVNALLASVASSLVDDESLNLLLGGISALLVGGAAWWAAWRPDRGGAADAADAGRRVYLVVIFGASAIAAVVTLLLIGYRLFEFALGEGEPGGLLEYIRAPLGVLSATAVVFAYHFAIWRRDRAAAPRSARRRIGRVILVSGGDVSSLGAAVRSATGAAVSVWPAADGEATLGADPAPVLAALEQVSAPRVLVLAESAGGVRVVPLAD